MKLVQRALPDHMELKEKKARKEVKASKEKLENSDLRVTKLIIS